MDVSVRYPFIAFNSSTNLKQTEQQTRRKVPYPKLPTRKGVPIPKYFYDLPILPHRLLEMLISLRTDRGVGKMQCAQCLHCANHRRRRPGEIWKVTAVRIGIDGSVVDNQETRDLVDEMREVVVVGTLDRHRSEVCLEDRLLEAELSLARPLRDGRR